ncbi:MAG TPA: phosphoribosylaminoimidazolesuccinocarboxamide synthase [Clostridiales bacterium]|nr:phosphoribosylaminoimidazolesuccinocarboxamide synthase [Clostridiales bacterium]HQP69261.1 phosphoribosylaminoimidazolesuccinocarboxamide synthase [Clostridiales bacterium]
MTKALISSDIKDLKLVNKGKVREIYAFGKDKLLIVTSDRISAFDVVMGQAIPGKGKILSEISNFWFKKFENIIKNHIISIEPEKDFPELAKWKDQLEGRSVVVHKCKPLPVEAIVRGYLAGSGLKEYNKSGTVCGIKLEKGLKNSSKIKEPIFTPSTKAEIGQHDENISFEKMKQLVDPAIAERVKEISLKLYKTGRDYAEKKGIIIADTKFEFGILGKELVLIDEVLTPDSSRFWPLDDYKEGQNQKSFDKQYLRDYLEKLTEEGKWDKNPPAPKLPAEVTRTTAKKYKDVLEKLVK